MLSCCCAVLLCCCVVAAVLLCYDVLCCAIAGWVWLRMRAVWGSTRHACWNSTKGSPFDGVPGFDEADTYYHGATAVAIEAVRIHSHIFLRLSSVTYR